MAAAAAIEAPWGMFDLLQLPPASRDAVDFADGVLPAVVRAVGRGVDPALAARAGGVLARPTWLRFYVEVWCAENYYAALGVGRKATAEAITKAYRKRSLECHPDRRHGLIAAAAESDRAGLKAQADEDFKFLGHIYETLRDQRREYDRCKCPQRFRVGGDNDDAGRGPDFNDTEWAPGQSECDEVSEVDSEAEAREFFASSADEAEADGRKRGAGGGGARKGKRKSKRRRRAKGDGAPKPPPPPPDPHDVTLKVSVAELWQGTFRAVRIPVSVKKEAEVAGKVKMVWATTHITATIPIPDRCVPGELAVWAEYGEYVAQAKRRRDVRIAVEADWDAHFALRPGAPHDVETEGTIGALFALLATGAVRYRHPGKPGELLEHPNFEQLHTGHTIRVHGQGLRASSTTFGDLVIRVKLVYPPVLPPRQTEAMFAAMVALCADDPERTARMCDAILGPEDPAAALV